MDRFYGEVGYGRSIEKPDAPGVWVDEIIEYKYQGDILRNKRNFESGDRVINDLTVSHSISVVADEYAIKNVSDIKYVRWAGGVWTVTDVLVQSPRLILTLGGVYNGPTR